MHTLASGMPQMSATPLPPHVAGNVHGLQYKVSPPQPSDCWPHSPTYSAHVFGTHAPHWLATPPPPHVAGGVQVSHVSSPPQPSDCVPHAFAP
jgi:hypothetical protein